MAVSAAILFFGSTGRKCAGVLFSAVCFVGQAYGTVLSLDRMRTSCEQLEQSGYAATVRCVAFAAHEQAARMHAF